MEPSSCSKSTVASEADDNTESADDEEDYSFSLSGLPEEDNDADVALLSRALEDSVSFSFSIENAFESECGTFGFAESSPLRTCAHAGALETSSACHNIKTQHDQDEESGSLVPFKISGSWRAESSLCHYSRHAESRRSFSFLTDKEHETEHLEELVMHVKGSTIETDSGPCGGGKHTAAHAGGKHEVEDDDDKCVNRGNYQGVLDDQDALCKHGHDDHDNAENNVCRNSGNNESRHDESGTHDHGKYADHEHTKRSFSDELSADSIMRLAGEGLLQPWSSSKVSKSCRSQVKQDIGNLQGRIHSSNVSSSNMNYMYPLLSHPSDINNNFGIKATGMRPTARMQGSFESEPFSPKGNSFMKGLGSPTHVPLYMPTARRKTSSLFERRVQNAGETLSLLVNAQRHSTAFNEAALSPPTSKGSAYNSSYRTSSIGSAPSSGYSSSSGKSSTPTSRHLSRNVSLIDVRCSLRQRMDGEPHTQEHPNAQMHRKGDPSSPLHRKDAHMQRKEDPNSQMHRKGYPSSPLHRKGDPNAHIQRKEDSNAQLHKKGDPNAYLHRKGDPSGQICEEGDSCKSMRAQAPSKAKTDPFATGHGLMSPSMSPTPRSPMSWRSVLSLQPLNPSHVPLDEWEILGKPSSRSHSQRSRSSSRGSSREGRRSSLMSAEFLGLSSSRQTSLRKEDKNPNTQKLVKSRRGYWALNPMKWFRQCRNDKHVVDTSNLDSMEQKRRRHAVYK